MATKHDLLQVLSEHIGAAKGIRGQDLAHLLNVSTRELRKLISQTIQQDATAICGQPSTGYYIASCEKELKSTIEFHKCRAMHELRKASQLSKIPLADLVGQLHLRT